MTRFKDMSIQYRILIIGIFIILGFTMTVFLYLLPRYEESIIAEKREKLKDIVQTTFSYLESRHSDSVKGLSTLEESKQKAIQRIKAMRYGPEGKDYLWINDQRPYMVMHPFRPDLDGKDLSDYKDPEGKRLFVEMAKVCREKGSGYVDYMWQWKDQKEKIVPKISYVKAFEPFGWIIGTGIYIEDVRDQIRAVTFSIGGVFLLIVIISLGLLYLFSRSIRNQLKMGVDFSHSIAEGDLTKRIDLAQEDEIGLLVRSLNKAVDNVEKLISDIVVAAQNLAQAVEEIASGNENLSQRTTEQASALEEIASTIEQANASIAHNSDNSQAAREIAQSSFKLVQEGNEIVSSSVDSMKEIDSSSKRVGEILTVINEIAFQTNLLALNAAVEAARAGNEGRGFAVVAGEVRNLAQRSAAAAREIEGLIKETIVKVSQGMNLSTKSGESLERILSGIEKVNQSISEIAAASEEQRSGISQINTAIMEMDSMTQENSALVEQTASASEEMSAQARELLSMMERFKVRDIEREQA